MILVEAMGVENPIRLQPDRVVHRFDFDEWAQGNMEDLPRHWSPLHLAGFPLFARGFFDPSVGHTAPPSLYLAGEGRSVALQYHGPDIPVRDGSEYWIEGFIRADRLEHARACLSAHFVDKSGNVLLSTLVRSAEVGGVGDEWIKVEFGMPSAPPEAATIGLVAWLLQQELLEDYPAEGRRISLTDVEGGAWFDDLTIHAFPRVELKAAQSGNVLGPEDVPELRVLFTHHEDGPMHARLTIRNDEGGLFFTRMFEPFRGEPAEPQRVNVRSLPVGIYHADLQVFADQAPIVTRSLTFARAGPLYHAAGAVGRAFGVVLDPAWGRNSEAEYALLQRQGVRLVKVPLGLPTDRRVDPSLPRSADSFLPNLIKTGFRLTAIVSPSWRSGDPSCGRGGGVAEIPDDSEGWSKFIDTVMAPYSGAFYWWQIGFDGGSLPGGAGRLQSSLEALHSALCRVTPPPSVALPCSPLDPPWDHRLPVEQIALTLGRETPWSEFEEAAKRLQETGYGHVSAFVPTLPEGRYGEAFRLADWAQRIIAAKHAGFDSVWVQQTWHLQFGPQGMTVDPTRAYLMLRTISDFLSDALPGPAFEIAPGITCLAFHERGSTTLALWSSGVDGPKTRSCPLQLGRATRQIDLLGNSRTLASDEHGRKIVEVSTAPTFVDGVESWLIDLMTSVTLSPVHVESGSEMVRHTLHIHGQKNLMLGGDVVLETPSSWQVSPRRMNFQLVPGQGAELPFEVRYPHNERSGTATLLARIQLDQGPYTVEIPLSVEIGLAGVEVAAMAFFDKKDLLLRQTIINRTSGPLNLRAAADVPGRQRQYRPVTALPPGASRTLEYRFEEAGALSRRTVRLGFRELADHPRRHTLELTVP